MTKLTKPISRETNKTFRSKPVVLTIAPGGDDALIGVHLKGERTRYWLALSDVYRYAALAHGRKEALAKREARRNGIPWRTAKRTFNPSPLC